MPSNLFEHVTQPDPSSDRLDRDDVKPKAMAGGSQDPVGRHPGSDRDDSDICTEPGVPRLSRDEFFRRKRSTNVAIALMLLGLTAILFLVTLVKLGGL